MTQHRDLYIDAEYVPGSSGTTSDVDPYTGEVFATVAAASPADATRAVDAASAAFGEWSRSGALVRRRVFLTAADVLERRREEAVELMRGEVGATRLWAEFNVGLAANVLREAAATVTSPRGEVLTSDAPGELGFSMRQPAGVVAAFAPWNAPLILGARSLAVPLAVGNTVVVKPSEDAPLAAGLFFADVLAEAGLPAGVLNVVTNAREDAAAVGNALISDRRVRRVNFTGSTEVGRAIGVEAARHLKPAVLELGGKNSVVVLDDADLDYAVDAVTFGAFMNAGQICMSADRILVPKALREEFAERFAAKVAGLKQGDPAEADTVIGPLIDSSSAERVAGLVDDAVAKGAVVHTGGGRPKGSCYPPTVLSGVDENQRLYSEEIFGPVSTVLGYDDVEEAIAVANDTPYGLSAGVITENTGRGWAVARRLHTGVVHVNDQTVGDEPQAPFGGVGDSGYGHFGGRHGVESFTDTRWVTFREGQVGYPF